ncbi:MAG TPA: enoyl-CoA hydratase-related protein [Phycisphaerae bacterium]|nr:enoyl-CoA hydratase-related protein [Phycisphaerae bacterium]
MSHETLLISDSAGTRTITLNRPDDLNSIDDRVTKELQAELRGVVKDRGIRCLVLTGAGRGFCAGQDLKSVMERKGPFDFTEALRKRYNPVISALKALEIPTIASINGVAAGAGWSLALACDLRIASTKAKFVSAFSKIGLVPDSGMTWTLPRLVGLAKALEIAWIGDPISAETALQLGLVNRLAEPEELARVTGEWANALAKSATKGLGLTKRAMYAAIGNDLDVQLEYEAQLQGVAGKTKDYSEGVKAFIEKRPAEFTGE